MELVTSIALSVSFSLYFLVIAANVPSGYPLALVALPGLASGLLILLFRGRKQISGLISSAWPDRLKLMGAALFGFTAFQSLQVIKRYGYAPPLTDIVLFLSLAPLFTYIISAIFCKGVFKAWSLTALILALAGTVATVGNWELPSTLMPFAKFPLEESLIVLASLSLSVSIVLISTLPETMKKNGLFSFILVGTTAAFILLVATDGFKWIAQIDFSFGWNIFVVGCLVALFYGAIFRLMSGKDSSRMITAFMGMPLVLTFFHIFDASLGYWGESPFRLVQVVTGSAMILAGISIISNEGRFGRLSLPVKRKWLKTRWAISFLSLLSIVTALVSLAYPQVEMRLSGELDSGIRYAGTWTLFPYQTLLGVLLIVSALAVFFSVVSSLIRNERKLSVLSAVIPGLGVVSALLIGSTPIVNWTDLVPAEIVHAIGTEYVKVETLNFLNDKAMNSALLVSLGLLAVSVVIISGVLCNLIVSGKRSLL